MRAMRCLMVAQPLKDRALALMVAPSAAVRKMRRRMVTCPVLTLLGMTGDMLRDRVRSSGEIPHPATSGIPICCGPAGCQSAGCSTTSALVLPSLSLWSTEAPESGR